MPTQLHTAWLVLGCLLVAGHTSGAQSQLRSAIVGTITGENGVALSGATVTLQKVGENDPQPAMTNARGEYRFLSLTTGDYALTVNYGAMSGTRTVLRLAMEATLTVDIALRRTPGADAETGTAPTIDVTTAAPAVRFSREDLENLPIGPGRALMLLAPGITPRSAFGAGGDTSELTVDDGPITLSARGNGTMVAAFEPYWMEEAAMVGPAASAGPGTATGGAARIVLKSGGNQFSGLVEYRRTPSNLVGDNTGSLAESLRAKFQPTEIFSRWDTSAQAGGPIRPDRIFFFGGAHYARDKTHQAGTIGNVPFERTLPAAVVKFTWRPRRDVRASFFAESNGEHAVGKLNSNAMPETANDQTMSMQTWGGRVNWTRGAATAIDAQVSGVRFDFTGIPPERRSVPTVIDMTTGIRSGNLAQYQDQAGRRELASVTASRFADRGAGGRHLVRFGWETERTTYTNFTAFPGGQSFTIDTFGNTTVQLWAGDRATGTGWRTSLFAQDDWSVGRRVTLQPGVRVSVNRGSVPDKGTVFRTSPVSPQIGVAWDISADHRTVVRASAARVHEGLFTPLFDFMNTAERTPKISANVDADGTFVETSRQTPAAGNVAVASHLAHAAVDQIVAGVEREIATGASLGVTYINRRFGNIWALVDTGSQYALVDARDQGPDGKTGTADDATVAAYKLLNSNQSFTVLTNPDDATRRYDAVQVFGQKIAGANWRLFAAYTWSNTRGTVGTGDGDNRAAGADTGMSGVFINPNRAINADGPAGFDYRHQAIVQGVYLVPVWGGVGVSAGYTYLSGGAVGRTVAMSGLAQVSQIVRVEPRGTRRIEGTSALDVRVEKTFRLGAARRTLGIYADVLNATNEGIPLALTIIERTGATYREPTEWATPRTVRIAGRFRF